MHPVLSKARTAGWKVATYSFFREAAVAEARLRGVVFVRVAAFVRAFGVSSVGSSRLAVFHNRSKS
jgi:hypothetical protein